VIEVVAFVDKSAQVFDLGQGGLQIALQDLRVHPDAQGFDFLRERSEDHSFLSGCTAVP